MYEVYLDVYYIIKPSVTIHSPVDGDTLTNTNRPMLNYTGTFDVDGPGIASANVEIMVVNDANYGRRAFTRAWDEITRQVTEATAELLPQQITRRTGDRRQVTRRRDEVEG